MKAILMDEETPVYASIEDNTISIATIHKGEEIELGKVIQKKRKSWVEVNLGGERMGYITGDTKIFAIRKATVMNPSVDVKEAAADDAPVIKTLTKGSVLTVCGVEKPEGGTDWFKVRDEAEVEGFVPTSTKLRVVPELSQSNAIRNLVTGLIFAAIGVFFAVSNNSSSSGSSMIWISYAVIFFGLLQFGQGAYEYMQIVKKKKKDQ
mgnify:CR=1 FL=1|jgi:hypothetical protein